MAKKDLGLSRINPDLAALARPLDSLRADDRNARSHDERGIAVVMKSLTEHGQQKPIVILTDGKVIAGNGTLEAAKRLGWSHLACVAFDSADEAKARAYAIVDNRSSDLSGWNFDVLSEELTSLAPFDFELGFSTIELSRLFGSNDPSSSSSSSAPVTGEGEAGTTTVSAHQRTVTSREIEIAAGDTVCPKCGFEFDRDGSK